jgi:hypothetical protein
MAMVLACAPGPSRSDTLIACRSDPDPDVHAASPYLTAAQVADAGATPAFPGFSGPAVESAPAGNAIVAGRCATSGAGLRRALQQGPPEQCHRLHHAAGHARRGQPEIDAERDRKLGREIPGAA